MPTLLVLDDEPAVTALLRDILQDEGFRVIACNAAQSALAVLATARVDLILTDVMMPGIDGLAFARLARAQPGCPPILFLSAGPLGAVQAAFPDAAVLAKPFEIDALLQRITTLLPVPEQWAARS